jgi:hypothetical protein
MIAGGNSRRVFIPRRLPAKMAAGTAQVTLALPEGAMVSGSIGRLNES